MVSQVKLETKEGRGFGDATMPGHKPSANAKGVREAQAYPVTVHKPEIEINEKFKEALEIIGSGKSVFITGRAGTGKSTLLEHFRENTRKKIAVLAPTGVAAVNVKGQTIHSFFRFGVDITPESVRKAKDQSLYRNLDAIIIDEVSMVRADLLDCVDKALRLNGPRRDRPFGGVQMVFIGDLYQLPPVVTGKEKAAFSRIYKSQYFFDSRAFQGLEPGFVELEKVYRQKDGNFISLLNAVRNNSVTKEDLEALNSRVGPFFRPPEGKFYITLTTTNAMADEANALELAKLGGKAFRHSGKLKGGFDYRSLPAELELVVKPGSQVMLANNDPAGRWVNGTMGKVVSIGQEDGVILTELQGGMEVEVKPFTWNMYEYQYVKETKSLEAVPAGSFTQYPIKLAWAVTIHKGQGKTFENVIIDIGKGAFSHGQVYVALSRCTSLEGIVLKKPIQKGHIWMDWKVPKFLSGMQYKVSDKALPLERKVGMINKAIKSRGKLQITYLKASDTKSKRVIRPERVGEMEYMGKSYLGVEAFCEKAQEMRTFRVDRILEIAEA